MHFRLAADFIEKTMDRGTPCSVLDLGCNVPPAFLEYLTGRHRNISGFGCDIREGTAASGRREDRIRIDLLDISSCSEAYPRECFDFIFAGEVIEHLKDTDSLFEQSSALLKRGGYLIVTTPNLAAWYERLMLLFGLLPVMAEVSDSSRVFGRRFIYRLMGRKQSGAVGHLRLFTTAALRDLGEFHGFEVVTRRGYWTLDFFLNRWISRLRANLAQGIFMVFRKPAASPLEVGVPRKPGAS